MLSPVCFGLSAIALGCALQIHDGFYDPTALTLVTVSLVLCGVGAAGLHSGTSLSRRRYLAVCVVLGSGIAWQLAELYTAKPGFSLDRLADMRLFKGGLVVETVMVALGLTGRWWAARVWFPTVLALNLALGVWILDASPDPAIDVVTVHRGAIDALLHRADPYRISFENIYGEEAQNFYNPEAIVGNRLAFGYPYPPVSLLFVVPGQVLAHDFRYSELVALVVGAAFVGFSRPGLVPKLAACLLLTTPRGLYVLESGWTEPVQVLLLAATVFLMLRRPVAAAGLAGLLILAKQYLVLAAVPFLRFVISQRRQRWPAMLLIAAFAAAATTLPFALWHTHAFLNSTVWLQTREPFRVDSLSYLSWAARAGWGQGSLWWAIGAACLATAAAFIITPNTPAGFAASIALYSFAMFTFGSKAFCNYYFFVIGALCCALAACTAWPPTGCPGAGPPGRSARSGRQALVRG